MRSLQCLAQFKPSKALDQPFQLVHLDDYILQRPSNYPQIPDNFTDMVDKELTYGLSDECISVQANKSILYAKHMRGLQNLVISS